MSAVRRCASGDHLGLYLFGRSIKIYLNVFALTPQVASLDQLNDVDADEQFEFGLALLPEGLAARSSKC